MKLTGTPGIPAPLTSSTRAAISVVPPEGGRTAGVAVTSTRSAAAVPTRRFSSLADAPPENAVIVAVPLWPFEMNRTRTWPFCVRASTGSIRPSVVVKVMTVPFCTGVPAPEDDVVVGAAGVAPGVAGVVGVVGVVAVVPFSMAVATISISPLTGTVFDVAKSEITVPPGARSGTLSQAERKMMGRKATDARPARPTQVLDDFDCASIEKPKDNNLMGLLGCGGCQDRRAERGYAMAALLIALAIMAVLLTIAMPVWRHEARREKEAELVFRGEQYARAIALFKFKNANIPNAMPPSIDFLVQNRFLRKKYKDPMTKDGEFVLIGGGSTQPGAMSPGQTQPDRPSLERPRLGGEATHRRNPVQPGVPSLGMIGVRSKSEETSIRSYRGATRYDQWAFTFNNAPRPGGAMPNANSPDGRGNANPNPFGPGANPGGRNPRSGGPGGFNNPRRQQPGEPAPGRAAATPPSTPRGGRSRWSRRPEDLDVGSDITVVVNASASYQSE